MNLHFVLDEKLFDLMNHGDGVRKSYYIMGDDRPSHLSVGLSETDYRYMSLSPNYAKAKVQRTLYL